MRLWSLHPKYLDRQGLLALWREGLLAQTVLRGRAKGYRRHPQLSRFHAHRAPAGAIADYLRGVYAESVARGYQFEHGKIRRPRSRGRMTVTRGQVAFEWRHLMAKLRRRDPALHAKLAPIKHPRPHPFFRIVPGPIEPWEKTARPSLDRSRPSRAGEAQLDFIPDGERPSLDSF